MKKSEELKTRRKIKFKCFLLANVLTLFFALANFSFAADKSFDFGQKNAYSEPFSKLIEFLEDKKEELEKSGVNFTNEKIFSDNNNVEDDKFAAESNHASSFFLSAVFESANNFISSAFSSLKDFSETVTGTVKGFVFSEPNQNNFEYTSKTSLSADEAREENAKEIEILKQQYEDAINEANDLKQNFTLLQSELMKIKNSGVVVREPVIEQRAVEKTIEKIISGLSAEASAKAGLSQADLDSGIASVRTELNNLNTNLLNKINTLSVQSSDQNTAVYRAVSLTNKIDNLSGTSLSNITVSGVTGLADSDIPDTITASSYLPLTGGTISGSLTLSGQTSLTNATATSFTADNAWFTDKVGIGTTSPYAKLSVVGPIVAEYFHATSTTATSTFGGQLVAGFAPTLTHSFGSWSMGVAGANPLGASLIINPSSAASDSNLLSLSVNGSAKFLVDAEGDVFANGVTVVGGTTLSTTTAATFTVENNTVLGDSTTTDITYFNSRIADSLIPTADNALDLGDSANWLRWRTGYFGTSVGIGGTATSTGSQLTASGAYLVDSNGTLSINTTNNKAVSFGTGNVSLPYASTTALTVSGSAYIGSLNGPLQANNGLVSATTTVGSIYGGTGLDSSALTGIAQIVAGTWSASSTLSTAYGGTGWNSLQANSILLGNGAGRIATTSAGTDGYILALSAGIPTWLATSTLDTITGTLAVAKGGTGQTSFGQGWLHSDGTTLTSSTSPTVAYLTATSTTATSTFAGGMNVAGTSGLTVLQNGNVGVGTTTPGGKFEVQTGIATTTIQTIAQFWSGSDRYDRNSAVRIWNTSGGGGISMNQLGGTNAMIDAVSEGLPFLDFTSTVSNDGVYFFVGNTGKTGINDGTPDAQLEVSANNSTPDLFMLSSNDDNDGDRFIVKNSGNIGIGTTSPYAKLSVVGEVVASRFTATSTTASTFPYASTTALTVSGSAYIGSLNGPLQANNGLVSATTTVGSIYGGTGLDSSALTGIAQIVAGTWSASSTLSTAYGGTGWNNIASGYAIFGNGAGALATSSSFYWDNSNSRLGIGTTTPDSKLTVFNNADDSAIEFSSASGSTYKWTMGMDYSDAGKFKIASSTALGTLDRFTIDGNGYVGIGTSTPARRLDVADSGNNNPQLRLSRETNVYTDLSVAQTTGDLSLSLYGTNADDISLFMPDGSTGANLWVCEGAACPNGISFTGGGNLFVEGEIKYATSTTPKTRRSIILTAAGAIVPTANGAAKTQVDGTNHSYYVLDFDASADEAAFWQWTMPDSYDNGSVDITYYWEAGATSGDSIFCFQAKGLSANSAEDIDSALSSAVCETDTAQGNANDLASMTETNATSNFAAGEYATFKIFRDADAGGDTMTGDARLVKVKIEYGVAAESD